MRIGSLFSGYGGLDHAAEEVFGATTAWVSDIDKGACKILAHRYPTTPNIGDITKVDWSTVEPVDVLCGGSPCQDLSHAGRRQGMTEGTRSNLWVAMREAIAQLRPRYVVWENVRGAYSAEADSELESDPRLLAGVRRRDGEPVLRALGRVLGDLSDLGYDCRWHGLRAADVGAPHGRFRVFVVAHTQGDEQRERLIGVGERPESGRGAGTPADAGSGSGEEWGVPIGVGAEHAGAGRGGSPVADTADLGHERAGSTRGRWTGPADRNLLPTPRATDGTKGGPNQRGSSGDLMPPSAVALLPTPQAQDAKGHNPGNAANRAEQGRQMQLGHAVAALLPTPAVNDMGAGYTPETWDDWTDDMKARHGNGNGHGKSLAIEAQRLLPTPKATNNENRQDLDQYGMNLGQALGITPLERERNLLLGTPTVEMSIRSDEFASVGKTPSEFAASYDGTWGDYAAAIARWEHVLGRPAPAPTQLSEQYVKMRRRRLAGKDPRPIGRRGSLRPAHQLSPRFVEFLMGLPAGWVTDVPGITRNEALKALGNGVVSQQAVAALRTMLAWEAVAS